MVFYISAAPSVQRITRSKAAHRLLMQPNDRWPAAAANLVCKHACLSVVEPSCGFQQNCCTNPAALALKTGLCTGCSCSPTTGSQSDTSRLALLLSVQELSPWFRWLVYQALLTLLLRALARSVSTLQPYLEALALL